MRHRYHRRHQVASVSLSGTPQYNNTKTNQTEHVIRPTDGMQSSMQCPLLFFVHAEHKWPKSKRREPHDVINLPWINCYWQNGFVFNCTISTIRTAHGHGRRGCGRRDMQRSVFEKIKYLLLRIISSEFSSSSSSDFVLFAQFVCIRWRLTTDIGPSAVRRYDVQTVSKCAH